jgi:hypothetical protein
MISGLSVLAFGIYLLAQEASTGIIEGTVKDSSGAVVPGVTVTVKSITTGFTATAISNDTGYYRIEQLPVGTYEVRAELTGFAPVRQAKLKLQVGQKLTIDLTLGVAGQAETVTVTSEAPVVETSKTQVSSIVSDSAVANLPVNGRNFIDFVLLTPGVTRDAGRSGDISFAGQRGTLNSLQIDGTDNNNTFFGQTLGRTGSGRAPYQFSQDAVQEFQVNTSTYSAELGRAGGAVINVVTKSGTNDFHGSIFEFYRDRALNANSFFNNQIGRRKPAYHFNQFGGNIGGPIAKNKAFFFFDYDGQRNNNPQVVIFGGRPFPTDAASQQAAGQLAKYETTYNRTFNQDVYLTKVDAQLGESNRLSGRWNSQRFTGRNLENSGQTSAEEHSGNSLVKTDTITLSLNSIITPRFLNEARYQWARDKEPGTANSDVPEAIIQQGGLTVVNIGRNNFSPRETTIKRNQVIDNIALLRGNHAVRFGVDYNHDRIKNFFPGLFGGQYTFSSLANFANRVPLQYVQAFAGANTDGPLAFPNSSDFSAFIQDDWKASRRLTLNFGLRYDFQLLRNPGVKNSDSQLLAAGIDTSRVPRDKNNFGPRFGLAWSPREKFVVRGGYGIFYGRTPAIMLAQAFTQNGISVSSVTFRGAAMPTYPNRFDSIPSGGSPATPNLYFFNRDYVNPYTQQASLGFEFEVAQNTAFNISYLMVKGTHLTRTRDINLLAPVRTVVVLRGEGAAEYFRFPGPQNNPTRPFTNFGRLSEYESNSNSFYNGLILQLTRHYAQNFQAMISYTVSKAIDDNPDATSVVAFNSGDDAKMVQNPFNMRDDRSVSVVDQRQRLAISGIWDLNYLHDGAPPAARALLNHWQVSGIITIQSGRPYSGVLGTDLNNDSNRFTDRTPGQGRNTHAGDNFAGLDLRVTRYILLGERLKLQLIGEAFNLFNRTNFAVYNNTEYSLVGTELVRRADFGTPRDTFDPRIFQLAAKILF